MPTPIPVGFVLLSNSRDPQPSTRISVLKMLPYLRAAGYDPHILFEPEHGDPEPDPRHLINVVRQTAVRAVYFQKVHGPRVVGVTRQLSTLGVRTIYGVCDFVDDEMAAASDVTVVVTDFLKSLYRPDLQAKIRVVHDGIERPEIQKTSWRDDRGSTTRPLKAILVTSSDLDHLPAIGTVPPFVEILVVGRYPPKSDHIGRVNWARWKFASIASWRDRWRLFGFLANRRIERVHWDANTVYTQMSDADIAIIPVDMIDDPVPGSTLSWWQVKSENRLTMQMSLGLPVIASPVPSYLPVIDHGRNGYVAATPKQWRACFDALRDPHIRREVGAQARASVSNRFSMDAQAATLVNVFDRLVLDH